MKIWYATWLPHDGWFISDLDGEEPSAECEQTFVEHKEFSELKERLTEAEKVINFYMKKHKHFDFLTTSSKRNSRLDNPALAYLTKYKKEEEL